ncbi:MAG: hypothetical protein JO007_05840 [Alphaproteobacteria bacterium]|nr:hypothetical protein [Alphaproteobacteria bacterium]
MIARAICTAIVLLLAFYAFWGNAFDAGHVFNPVGILFLLIAYIAWFKWDIVQGALASAKGESNIPILRMGYKILQGFGAKAPTDPALPRRSSDTH